jgi:hypothetical protein
MAPAKKSGGMATALKKEAPVPLPFVFSFLSRIAAVGGRGC